MTIQKIPNTSIYSENGVSKITITKQDILNSGAQDLKSILDKIPGLDLKQNGQAGQLTSLFSRGTNSNHTLVLLNGVAINDHILKDYIILVKFFKLFSKLKFIRDQCALALHI